MSRRATWFASLVIAALGCARSSVGVQDWQRAAAPVIGCQASSIVISGGATEPASSSWAAACAWREYRCTADRAGARLSGTRCEQLAVAPVTFQLALDSQVVPYRLRITLDVARGLPRIHAIAAELHVTGPGGFELSEPISVPLFEQQSLGCDPPAGNPDACRNHVDPIVPLSRPAFEPASGGWPFFDQIGDYVVELRNPVAVCNPAHALYPCRQDQVVEIEPLRFQIEPWQLRQR